MDVLTVLLIVIAAVSFLAWNKPDWMQRSLFIPYRVKHSGEYYRFLSSGFIHADYLHLGLNLFVLWNFGEVIQISFVSLFGEMWSIYFLGLFLGGVIVADIPTYLKYKDTSHYRSLGASGGVASVVFAFIFLYPLENLYFFMIPLPAILYGFGYLFYTSYQDKKRNDNINHSAHFWGSLYGIVYLAILKPDLVVRFFHQLTF